MFDGRSSGFDILSFGHCYLFGISMGLIKLRNPGPLGQSKIPPSGVRDNQLCL
jgi:hypothetical protein